MANTECCTEDGKVITDKSLLFRRRQGVVDSRYFEIENPIPDQIKDSDDLTKFFTRFPYIPFAGHDKVTAHSLLKKFIDYKILSVTTGATIESIKTYAFGGKIDIVKSFMPEFDLGDEEEDLPRQAKIDFGQFLQSIDLNGYTWKSLATEAYENRDLSGNAFLEVIFVETAGEKYAKFVLHNPTDCLYYATKEGQAKVIGISKRWDEGYLKKNPPRHVPVFPNYREFPDGSKRTIIHSKDGNEWYGRPASYSALIDQYNEYQIRTYTAKQASKMFLGHTFIEVEEDDPKNSLINDQRDIAAGYDSSLDRLEHNFSNKGEDPSTMMVLSRPYGAKEAKVVQIKPVADTKYLKYVSEESRSNITMAFDWSEALLRKEKTSGFNSEMFKDLFEIQSATKILRVQNQIADLLNTAIQEAIEFFGVGFEDYAIKFKSPIQNLIEQKAELDDNNSAGSEIE